MSLDWDVVDFDVVGVTGLLSVDVEANDWGATVGGAWGPVESASFVSQVRDDWGTWSSWNIKNGNVESSITESVGSRVNGVGIGAGEGGTFGLESFAIRGNIGTVGLDVSWASE